MKTLSPFPQCSVQLILKGEEIKGTEEEVVVISISIWKSRNGNGPCDGSVLLGSRDNMGTHCLLSYHVKIPGLRIPAKSIEVCALLIEAP